MTDRDIIRWTIDLFVPARAVQSIWDALSPYADAVAAFEAKSGAVWHVTAHCAARPARPAVTAAVAVAAASVGLAVPDIVITEVPPTDWLAENRRSFAPVDAGRFFVCSRSWTHAPPAGREVIRLDAGPAFGSGSHETTRGCLLALDALARQWPNTPGVGWSLDLGCGSGILAIAIAKSWRRPVLAADVDPVAVATTGENAHANGVAGLIRTHLGTIGTMPRGAGSFELIAANILAGPLIDMAGPLARAVARGGRLILSGLLRNQEPALLAVYRAQGLLLEDRITLGEWPTLIFWRPTKK